MNIFGLDIGSHSIKICQLAKQQDKKWRLVSAGLVPSPQPGMQSEQEADFIKVAEQVKKLYQEAKITTKDVVLSLPESQIFSRVIEMPLMSENELAQAVPWEAEQFIPMPLSEVTLDWQIVKPAAVGKEMEKMKIFIVAAPTVLIKKYIDIAEMAGLNVAAIESESLALARALQTASSPFSILVNFGAKSTDLTIAAGQKILLTRSISTAGEALTRAIATNLVLEPGQAEEYKKAYGLEEKEAEGKIRKALLPVLDVLANEIQKTILAWKEKENQPLSGLILAGGSAGLAQIGLYLASKLGLEVQTADPFSSLTVDPNFIAKLKPNASLFSVAVGLAQKEI